MARATILLATPGSPLHVESDTLEEWDALGRLARAVFGPAARSWDLDEPPTQERVEELLRPLGQEAFADDVPGPPWIWDWVHIADPSESNLTTHGHAVAQVRRRDLDWFPQAAWLVIALGVAPPRRVQSFVDLEGVGAPATVPPPLLTGRGPVREMRNPEYYREFMRLPDSAWLTFVAAHCP